jgi:uncharacterized protein (TIGR03435 family)
MRTCALLIVAASAGVLAQTPSGPTFDVVSITRHIPEPGPLGFNSTQNQRPDGGFTMTNIRIMNLIARAYAGVVFLPIDIVGMPGWATSDGYDVSATSTLTQASADDRAAMMRAMLVDRFKLVAHVEPREHPVFDLVLAREDKKLGAGLTKIDTDCAAFTAERAAEVARTGTPPAIPPQLPDFKTPPPPCFLRTIGGPLRLRLATGRAGREI